MVRLAIVLALTLSMAAAATGQSGQEIGRSIAEMRSFARTSGNRLWPGYGSAPFEFLLINHDQEQLLCRNTAPEGFAADGTDSATGCARYVRPRSSLPDSLLAAMPLFGPPSTIVMGTPQSTGRSDADWTRTILHEHFHQWQDSFPGVFERMAALDLADGDQTGMWMLNYKFPYADPAVVAAFGRASLSLARAVDARGKANFRRSLDTYLRDRTNLAKTAGARNWRYAELELWKEGVARWTEVQLGKGYPDPAVKASAVRLEQLGRAWLDKPDLAGAGREFVYPYGASEAMLLDACGSSWRRDYPKEIALGPLLQKAARTCRS